MYENLFLVIVCSLAANKVTTLLYPASSSFTLTSSVSVPITELLPERRAIFDWCFTMTYDLPSNLSSFYNVPIWPGVPGTKSKRDITNGESLAQFNMYSRKSENDIHPNDFTAGELYAAIEDIFINFGHHETCLLLAVCELARHPFADEHKNILTDLITFLLTPTQHDGFLDSELIYKETYKNAELQGFLGENCSYIYSDCKWNILESLTKIVYHD